MNIHRDTEYRFGELVQSPEYSNKQGVVVTIKSLATGQTMKVYLDEPTQEVFDGINVTNYEGHFYEEEFMVTPLEGFEVTGLPLMYPYWNGPSSDSTIRVIDAENHYYSEKDPTSVVDSANLADSRIRINLVDSQDEVVTGGNVVIYTFTRVSEQPREPIIIGPGTDPREEG